MRPSDVGDVWWKSAVVYCADVQTFQDSDGDGQGDLHGLTDRLDPQWHVKGRIGCDAALPLPVVARRDAPRAGLEAIGEIDLPGYFCEIEVGQANLMAMVLQVDGMSVPLTILSEDELEYDYQYTTYELVPGAVRVDGMDYAYRFEGKYLVASIDGREVQFQRDVNQLLGTWQGTSEGRLVSITFLSDKQLRSKGKVSSYRLTPGSIHADDKCIPYRMRKGCLVLAVPDAGEVVLTKVKTVTPSSWQALQGAWQAQRDWETLKLDVFSASQLQ